MIRKGDIVALFHEYGPEKCSYLGLAEYIGEGKPPDEASRAGEFDGRHVKLNKWTGTSVGSGDKQMSFRLLESADVAYEQEVWFAPKEKLQKLLDGCENIHAVELSDVRSGYRDKKEREKLLPLAADGFLEVHLSFKDVPLPREAKLGDFDTEGYLIDRLEWALHEIGFKEEGITFKMRELNEHPKREE